MSNLGNAQDLGVDYSRTTRKKPKKIEIGDKVGEWRIIGKEPGYKYKVECSCGTVTTVGRHSLVKNRSKMCTICAMKERRRNRHERKLIFEGKI